MPSKFIEIASKSEVLYTFAPYSIYKEYGIHLDDMDMNEWYDKLVENENVIKKEVNPRKLLINIAKMQFEAVIHT